MSHRSKSNRVPVCGNCGTCHFFQRFTDDSAAGFQQPAMMDDSKIAMAVPILSTEPDADLVEYGRCVRNPPQFFSETLNGEWPVIHNSRVCGEYRPNGVQN